MWINLAALVVGMTVGAGFGGVCLDRWARHKHGKSYSKWIKDDFDLQWNIIQRSAFAPHFAPFSDWIQKMSPQFCALYVEAAVAENAPLSQLAGLGYGKALECLIKDYAKTENPGNEAAIEAAPLGACLKQYLQDDLVKNSAELATWLRNDQVHYLRKHEKHGVPELKSLIKLIVSLVEVNQQRKAHESTVSDLRNEMSAKSVAGNGKDGPPKAG
jgi:hypothetical protein